MSYFKDMQDDKEQLRGYDALKDTLAVSAELINSVNANKTKCFQWPIKVIQQLLILDYLVKHKGLSLENLIISAKRKLCKKNKNFYLN